ncbi:UTP--glucose-1-phosphate uridylyltransferase [Candidatus Parcubacteria bacterium]|jgi:UTP--glucose-1-phosphate uridylyltransferase|nr:MAG: UTP--glucose-1-phosphate uridylyltransferase [Candidatus Parcubacteria bacterium]
MQKIRKAVIPAAGLGTRFLPATKSMPKEMLPIVDKPIIQYVVEEAVASGIQDIIIVTSANKRPLEDHFDYPYELEKKLEESGKFEQLEEVRRIATMANYIYVRQRGPYGNASPVLSAKHIINNEPFAVLWGDEFIHAKPPRLKQMVEVYEKYGKSVISAVRIENREDVSKYGIADVEPVAEKVFKIRQIVEKPKPADAPSNLAAHGAYILTPEIFPHLSALKPGKGGELWLVDAINSLMKADDVYAKEIEGGEYYDTGNKFDYLRANIEFALQREDLKDRLAAYLKKILK